MGWNGMSPHLRHGFPGWEKWAEGIWEARFKSEPLFQRWVALETAAQQGGQAARLTQGIAQLRASSLLIGTGGLALTLGVPLVVWVGVFAALGAPYAEAKAIVQNANFQTGFSQGFVTGLLKWDWRNHVVPRFFKFGPGQINVMDRSLSYVAANALNEGLHTGYMHGFIFNDAAKKELLTRLKSLSPSTRPGNWSRLDQRDYVVELAGAGRFRNFFRTA